ncbi:hypothetical protein GCM10010191_24260 [Actinomadura vinacea]|uniref:DoxX family protein n=1 Tax=Actinomadura vinacea TaxID=115336 RepID=A0ABP5W0Q4_9ACTN
MRFRPLHDIAALLARLGVGVVFIAHGWQKIEAGVTATSRSFDTMGVPLPTGAAVYSTFVELLGGAALIAGLGLPVAGALLFLDMAGALVFVHAGDGLFLVDDGTARNGFELVLVLGLASLLFAVGAGGRLTLDQWLSATRSGGGHRARRERETEDDGQSFVDALREAEEAPPKTAPPAPALPKRPRKKPQPSLPEAAAAPPPAPEQSAKARLATDIVSDTGDDTLVAGRRKPRRRRPDTQPIKRTGDDKDS